MDLQREMRMFAMIEKINRVSPSMITTARIHGILNWDSFFTNGWNMKENSMEIVSGKKKLAVTFNTVSATMNAMKLRR